MPFTLGVLIEATVLFINAIAILNEERFLKPMGFGANKDVGFDQNSFKDKIVSFISAVRMLMRIPLIAINIVIILYELVFG